MLAQELLVEAVNVSKAPVVWGPHTDRNSALVFTTGNLVQFRVTNLNQMNAATCTLNSLASLPEWPTFPSPSGSVQMSANERVYTVQCINRSNVKKISFIYLLNGAQLHPSATAVTSAAFYKLPGELVNVIGVGSLATVWGADLVGDCTVKVGGVAAPVIYTGGTQVNFQTPYELVPGSGVPVVASCNGKSSGLSVFVRTAMPSMFRDRVDGALSALVSHLNNWSLVTQSNPARRGEMVGFWMTGMGQTSPPQSTGVPAKAIARHEVRAVLSIQGVDYPAALYYNGVATSFLSLTQFMFTIPSDAPTGNVKVTVRLLSAAPDDPPMEAVIPISR